MRLVPVDEATIEELTTILRDGGVIAMPTETAYGLVADATNARAVDRVYAIKQRDASNPLPVVCASRHQVHDFFDSTAQEMALGMLHWPGAVSLVLQTSHELFRVGDGVTVNPHDTSVAVRVTSHRLLQQLAAQLEVPLVATSANISNQPTPYSSVDVVTQFGTQQHQPDLVLDSGNIDRVLPSTIIHVQDTEVVVLRRGPVEC